MTNSFSRQYSFPNVRVKETVQSPQAFTSVWRNTIGVAAPFNKGPLLAEISSRQELVNLYGEDNSLGSTFIRQAMLQGATNFVVSRVLQEPKGSAGGLILADVNDATGAEASIGLTDDRTVGLSVDLNLKTDPKVIDPNLVAFATDADGLTRYVLPTVNKNTNVGIDFEGIGNFVLSRATVIWKRTLDTMMRNDENVNTVPTEDLQFYDISDSSLTATTTGAEVKLVTIPKSATVATISQPSSFYLKAIRPGMEFTGGTDGPTFNSNGKVLSFWFEADDDNWGFYAEVDITAAGVNNSIVFVDPSNGGASDYPIIDAWQVLFVPDSSEQLDPDQFGLTRRSFQLDNVPNAQLPVSYLIFDRKNDPGVAKSIDFYTSTDNGLNLTKVASTITYKLGRAADTYARAITNNQTITFAKSVVVLGETDDQAAGWPNTSKSFAPGTPVIDVLGDLKRELFENQVLTRLNTDITINSADYPFSLTFQIGTPGLVGNSIRYNIKRFSASANPTDLKFEDNNVDQFDTDLNMVDGSDGIIPASRYFYSRQGEEVLFVQSISPGVAGNNVQVNIRPVDSANFILEVREVAAIGSTAAPTESYYLSNRGIDLQTGLYPETLNSNLIRAYYVPALQNRLNNSGELNFDLAPLRVAPPDLEGGLTDVSFPPHPLHVGAKYLQNINLEGGSEPDEFDTFIPEQSYIDAIDRLNGQDVAFISAPGLIAGDIRYSKAISALIQQAVQSTPYNGLRIAVLAAPPQLTPSRAELLNTEYNSERVVIIGGWSTLASASSVLRQNSTSPEGHYCGYSAVSDTYISPASNYNTTALTGVRSVDTRSDLDSLDAFTANNIEMLFIDSISRRPKFLNGRTTSTDSDKRWVSIRRQSDHLIMNVVQNLQWARSAPNTPEVQVQVASAVDAILQNELRRGAIGGYNRTVVNGDRRSQGFLDVYIKWTPIFPADYIDIDIVRTITSQFTLDLSLA